mmetsp:Transcript_37570/g.85548  ORF Transcript_37570/g.85548 Transcript_37570/m.85548 type:complete len:340 (+) Transcript_37570:371-1390(+)
MPAGTLPPGAYNLSMQIESLPWVPRLWASIGITIQKRDVEAVGNAYPEFPETGLMARTIRAAPSSPEAWRYLRSRLFSPPFLLTQTELVLLALASPTFFGHSNTATFRAQFPLAPRLARYKSCAVVGSAGHLRHSGLGKEVDRHETIVRINDAPTRGFEDDVGSRTTHRFVHRSPRVNTFLKARLAEEEEWDEWGKFYVESETLFWFLFDQNGLDMHLDFPEKDRGFVVSNAWVHSAWRYVACSDFHKTPTSGFMGILWALESCDEVRTFGFGRHPRSQHAEEALHPEVEQEEAERDLSAYKYYTNDPDKPWAYGHKWSIEHTLHDEMERSGLLIRRFD